VRVYHAKQHWQDAHVLIYANNRFRPAATEGGLISEVVSETVSIGATSVITYLPGQVAMGPSGPADHFPTADRREGRRRCRRPRRATDAV
jgi:hypothetical protein